jgi:outer membrane protein TolC
MRQSARVSDAEYEQAALNFRQTLQEALLEVENALSARTTLATRGDQLEAALRAAQTGERLYEARYRAGATTLRTWLDAQERRRDADLSLQANRLDELSNQVSLFLALGGSTDGA